MISFPSLPYHTIFYNNSFNISIFFTFLFILIIFSISFCKKSKNIIDIIDNKDIDIKDIDIKDVDNNELYFFV